MTISAHRIDPLVWLGRQGARAVAISTVVGIAAPPLAAVCRPAFTVALLVILWLAFLRVEPRAIRNELSRTALLAAAALWMLVAIPLLFGAVFMLLQPALGHQLVFGLVLNIIAPPVFSTPVFVALMGLEPALALAAVIACAAVTPLAAPIFAGLFIGAALPLAPLMLGLRLLAMLGGTAFAAAAVRHTAGRDWVAAQRERIDGLQVIAMAVFVIAAMDGVTAHFVSQPLLSCGTLMLAFAITIMLMLVTTLAFRRCRRADALALGIASAGRNMGLLIAAVGGTVPDLAWLYFALAQIPIYLLPLMFKRLARAADA